MRKTTEAQRRTWDLSQLGLIMWSAEPVQPDTVDRLLRRLCRFRPAPHELLPGLRPGGAHGRHLVERPRFGCATAGQRWPGRTLAVEDGDDVDAALLIGNGPPSAGVTVMIVDPETHKPVQNGQIGEIWVDSESKAPGYRSDDAATAATFHARIDGDTSGRSYLRTGDLGFLHAGEIFVTGRLKDMLILNGQPLSPGWRRRRATAIRPSAGRRGRFCPARCRRDGRVPDRRTTRARGGGAWDGKAPRRRCSTNWSDAVRQAVSRRSPALACHAVVVGTGHGAQDDQRQGSAQRLSRTPLSAANTWRPAHVVRTPLRSGHRHPRRVDGQYVTAVAGRRAFSNERRRLITDYLVQSIARLLGC
ncbi:MAG: AMP-binding protein [Caldilineaceae bacterium]